MSEPDKLQAHYNIAIIGGGAAGFFAAIRAAESRAGLSVAIFEKTAKVLSKVRVSGGGRCNVTHQPMYPGKLIKNYPRGGKPLRKAFERFGADDAVRWFEGRGVKLKTEADGRMFPSTDRSETIVECLNSAAASAGVQVFLQKPVESIIPLASVGFRLVLKTGESIISRKVIVTTGGYPKAEGYQMLLALGIAIAPPVPSLFTFNVPDSDFSDLQGISVPSGSVQIPGTGWKQDGPVLVTHWGFSAPAVIRLSAWAAVELHACGYRFPILINWTGLSENQVRDALLEIRTLHPNKRVAGNPCFGLPARLWERICRKAEIKDDQLHADLSATKRNMLVEWLVRSQFAVSGKTTWKEEFVTCGGVLLNEVDPTTFESVKVPGLYFAGEVLNADGITGGFNFQQAWTSGYLAGTHAASQVLLSPNS